MAVGEDEQREHVGESGDDVEPVVGDGLERVRVEGLIDEVRLQVEHGGRAHEAEGEQGRRPILRPQPIDHPGQGQVDQAEAEVEGELVVGLGVVAGVGHGQRGPTPDVGAQADVMEPVMQPGIVGRQRRHGAGGQHDHGEAGKAEEDQRHESPPHPPGPRLSLHLTTIVPTIVGWIRQA